MTRNRGVGGKNGNEIEGVVVWAPPPLALSPISRKNHQNNIEIPKLKFSKHVSQNMCGSLSKLSKHVTKRCPLTILKCSKAKGKIRKKTWCVKIQLRCFHQSCFFGDYDSFISGWGSTLKKGRNKKKYNLKY